MSKMYLNTHCNFTVDVLASSSQDGYYHIKIGNVNARLTEEQERWLIYNICGKTLTYSSWLLDWLGGFDPDITPKQYDDFILKFISDHRETKVEGKDTPPIELIATDDKYMTLNHESYKGIIKLNKQEEKKFLDAMQSINIDEWSSSHTELREQILRDKLNVLFFKKGVQLRRPKTDAGIYYSELASYFCNLHGLSIYGMMSLPDHAKDPAVAKESHKKGYLSDLVDIGMGLFYAFVLYVIFVFFKEIFL